QKAIKLSENSDKFVTITEKDRDLVRIYYDKMIADNGSIGAEVNYIEKLLNIMNIEGFDVLYPNPMSPDIFTLRQHNNDNAYVVRNKKTYHYYCHRADQETPNCTKKPSLKLVISETAEKQEKRLLAPEKIE
ncbi:10154_t:CDS:2, partial [Scutellospora calospora]